jgi:hypothetical protein
MYYTYSKTSRSSVVPPSEKVWRPLVQNLLWCIKVNSVSWDDDWYNDIPNEGRINNGSWPVADSHLAGPEVQWWGAWRKQNVEAPVSNNKCSLCQFLFLFFILTKNTNQLTNCRNRCLNRICRFYFCFLEAPGRPPRLLPLKSCLVVI